jgi:hypothetical protein
VTNRYRFESRGVIESAFTWSGPRRPRPDVGCRGAVAHRDGDLGRWAPERRSARLSRRHPGAHNGRCAPGWARPRSVRPPCRVRADGRASDPERRDETRQ